MLWLAFVFSDGPKRLSTSSATRTAEYKRASHCSDEVKGKGRE
jgi:hypothetical protein